MVEAKKESYIEQLVKYMKKNISKGYTLESLRWALISQGHSRVEVTKAMEIVKKDLFEKAPKLVEISQPIQNETSSLIIEDESLTFWQKIKSWFS